jgi:hypothetical protein
MSAIFKSLDEAFQKSGIDNSSGLTQGLAASISLSIGSLGGAR